MNTLVTYECIGAINKLKYAIFLLTFHFCMCTDHVLHIHTSVHKCHMRLITTALRLVCFWYTHGECMYVAQAHVSDMHMCGDHMCV